MVGERHEIAFVALALVGGTGRQWTEGDSLRLAGVIGGFIIAVLLLGIIILAVRRRMFTRDNELQGSRSLMEQLRVMRDRGQMSDEEYEATRRSLASKVAANVLRDAPVAPEVRGTRIPRGMDGTNGVASARVARPGFDLTGEPLPGGVPPVPPKGPEGPASGGRRGGSAGPRTPPPPQAPPGYADN